MDRPRTVLVLGAGASSDYGFPLGRDLRDRVCSLCASNAPRLVEQGFSASEVAEFGETLAHSGYTSVDWFLERYPAFMPIGRVAIAASLVPFENPLNLFPPGAPSNHWYEAFFNRMWSEDDASLLPANHITILTFNYDRSLEHYLRTVARTRTRHRIGAVTFEVRGPHRFVVAQGPTIVHLHGQLAHLEGAPRVREYSHAYTKDAVELAASGLQLLSEANPDSPEFVQAREAIAAAERAYFLGFGFHPKSVERLADFADAAAWKGKLVTGTHAGFTQPAWLDVRRRVLHDVWTDRPGQQAVFAFLAENPDLF